MQHFLNNISWRTLGRSDSDKIFTDDDVNKVHKIKKHKNEIDSDIKTEAITKLLEFFSKGKIVPPSDMPCNIVTIGSKVLLRQKHNDTTLELTISTTSKGNNKVSILSPLGLATLGLGVSDNIEFQSKNGIQFLTIDKILYQPQAFGAVA
jgi:regulator of nucleoside diphosphate kinase